MEISRINEKQYEQTAKMIERAVKYSQFSKFYPQSTIEEIVNSLNAEGVKQRASWTHFYVLTEKSLVVGCGAIGEYWGSKTESSLFSIFVDPDYQGMGYGRKIIETLEQDELFIRAKRIEVPAAMSAIPFYRKMGYEHKNGQLVFADGHFALEKFNKTRLAETNDLPELKTMFDKIVSAMEANNVFIWNEYYPYEEFENDIQNKNLYVMVDDDKIISAFGLFDNVSGSNCLNWSDKTANALYLGRFGVNPDFQNQGYGTKTINEAIKIAKTMNAKYLRLQVVDTNIPAINFYKKVGFVKVDGKFEEHIEETNTTLTELGFEIKL